MSNFISIEVNEQTLELPSNFNITFDQQSPLFGDNEIKGTVSFQSVISANSKVNRKIFNNPENIQNSAEKTTEYNCKVYLEGVLYLTGKLVLFKKITNDQYTFIIKSGSSKLSSIKDKQLNEFEYEKIIIPVQDYYDVTLGVVATEDQDNCYNAPGQIGPVLLEINGKLYTIDRQTPTTYNEFAQEMVDTINSDPDREVDATLFTGTPYGATFTSKTIGSEGVFTWYERPDGTPVNLEVIDDGYVSSTETQIINSIAAFAEATAEETNNETRMQFPMMRNMNFYDGSENSSFNEFVNRYESGAFVKNLAPDFFAYNICPFFRVEYILEKILEENGIEIKGDFFADTEIQNLLIYNNFALDGILNIFNGGGNQDFNAWSNVIHPKNHVPKKTFSEFINALRNTFCLAIDFSEKKEEVSIYFMKDVIADNSYIDITDKIVSIKEIEINETTGFTLTHTFDNDAFYDIEALPLDGFNIKDPVDTAANLPADLNEINDVRLVLDTNRYYKAKFNEDTDVWDWNFYSQNYYNYIFGISNKEIATNTSPILEAERTVGSNQVRVPEVRQKGSSNEFGLGINDHGLKFLFWRGMQPGDTEDYPLATTLNLKYDGSSAGNYTLVFDGDNGLFKQFWEDYANFLINTTPINTTRRIDIATIVNLNWSKKVMIEGQRFFIKNRRFTATLRGISNSEETLLKV